MIRSADFGAADAQEQAAGKASAQAQASEWKIEEDVMAFPKGGWQGNFRNTRRRIARNIKLQLANGLIMVSAFSIIGTKTNLQLKRPRVWAC